MCTKSQFLSFPKMTATSRMIPNVSLASGSDYLELNWKSPQYRPKKYYLSYLCIIRSTCLPNSPIADFIKATMLNLRSDITSIKIKNLDPNFICVLKIVATYNPASIDSGIVLTSRSLAVNTGKCTFAWKFWNSICIQLRNSCTLLKTEIFSQMKVPIPDIFNITRSN